MQYFTWICPNLKEIPIIHNTNKVLSVVKFQVVKHDCINKYIIDNHRKLTWYGSLYIGHDRQE